MTRHMEKYNPCLIIHGGHGNVTHSHDNVTSCDTNRNWMLPTLVTLH